MRDRRTKEDCVQVKGGHQAPATAGSYFASPVPGGRAALPAGLAFHTDPRGKLELQEAMDRQPLCHRG